MQFTETASTHLLVLLLLVPVCPHFTPVDARQGHGAAEQHHVHRLLSVPETLFLTAFQDKNKTGELSRLKPLVVAEFELWESVVHT